MTFWALRLRFQARHHEFQSTYQPRRPCDTLPCCFALDSHLLLLSRRRPFVCYDGCAQYLTAPWVPRLIRAATPAARWRAPLALASPRQLPEFFVFGCLVLASAVRRALLVYNCYPPPPHVFPRALVRLAADFGAGHHRTLGGEACARFGSFGDGQIRTSTLQAALKAENSLLTLSCILMIWFSGGHVYGRHYLLLYVQVSG